MAESFSWRSPLTEAQGEAFARLGEWVKNRLIDMFTIDISLPSWLGGSGAAKEKAARARSALGDVTVTEQYASGARTIGPTMALIGEGNAPECVIPTESKYRTRALALWQSAEKELGVPMMAEGGRSVGDWRTKPLWGGKNSPRTSDRYSSVGQYDLLEEMHKNSSNKRLAELEMPGAVVLALEGTWRMLSDMGTGAILGTLAGMLFPPLLPATVTTMTAIGATLGGIKGSYSAYKDITQEFAQRATTPDKGVPVVNYSFNITVNAFEDQKAQEIKTAIEEVLQQCMEKIKRQNHTLAFS